MFSGSGACRKCWSISCAPVRNSAKFFGPTAIITGSPTAPQTE